MLRQTRGFTLIEILVVLAIMGFVASFVIINGFVNFAVTEKLILNLSANNILDTIGLTEAEEGSIVEGQRNFVRARPLPGRSVSLGINYKF